MGSVCPQTEDGLYQRLKQLKPNASNGDYCNTNAKAAIQCCLNPDQDLCKLIQFDYAPPQAGSGIEGSFDSQIEQYVRAYNDANRRAYLCNHYIETGCKSNCKQYIEGKRQELFKAQEAATSMADLTLQDMLSAEIQSSEAVYKEICTENLGEVHACLGNQAQDYRAAAGKTLDCRRQAVTNSAPRHQIVCYADTEGLEQCQYNASDNPAYRDLADIGPPSEVDQAYGFMQTQDAKGNFDGTCSGTAFGDGSQAITAAHCFDPNGGKASLWFQDADGKMQQTTATCMGNDRYSPQGYNPTHHDTVLCNLDNPAHVKTNYFVATRDTSVRQGCIPEDYFLRCSPKVFESVDGQDVQVVHYPASQARDGYYRPIWSNGKLRYDRSTGHFYTDSFGDGGSSGAGYVTTLEGYPVIISNDSAKYAGSHHRRTPVIEWRDVSQMRADLSRDKIEGTDSIFYP